jgi:hypothetical protein
VTPGSSDPARLAFKRAFARYYLDLSSPAIADPTEAFSTCRAYLCLLREQLGPGEFMNRLDDETTHMVGQLEQDLRHRSRDRVPPLSYADLEERVRECFEHGRGGLCAMPTESSVE